MLREDLLQAIDSVSLILKESKVTSALALRQRSSGTEAVEIMRSFQILSRAESSFSPAARELVEIFRLGDIFNPDFWASVALVGDGDKTRIAISEVRTAVRVAISELPKFGKLLSRSADNVDQASILPIDEMGVHSRATKLTIILPEENGLSSPLRVAVALESISKMYEVVSFLRDADSSTLVLAACDSGSDKLFDFTGIDGILREVKELLIAFWDRIVFYGDKKAVSSIELVDRALPVLDEIEKKKEAGVLSPEQAEILRRKVITAATGIKDSGAILKEVNYRYQQVDVRKLAAPAQKLLSSAHLSDQGAVADGDPAFDADVEID